MAGPVSLDLLDFPSGRPEWLPAGYPAPIIASLVNGLLGRGHEVVVYTTSPDVPEPHVLADGPLIVCVAPRWRGRSAITFFARERSALGDLMREWPADVVHAQWTYEFAWAALDSGMPSVVTVHDWPPTVVRYRLDAYRVLRAMMSPRVFLAAPILTTVSEYLYRRMPAKVRRRTVIVPDFVDEGLVGSGTPLDERRPAIVTVSNGFGRLKNVHAGLSAFALMRGALPEFEYRLVGDGMGSQGLAHAFAERNGLDTNVRFIGSIRHQDVLEEVARARIVLHCSLEESFGMSVLEAMALGTPVVGGSSSGNVPYLLEHGRAGVLCDMRAPQDIAESLVSLLGDAARWASLSREAEKRARRFTTGTVLSDYEGVYERAMTEAATRRHGGV
jgi:glycosyltransferase involved in cell wall biosynthesis